MVDMTYPLHPCAVCSQTIQTAMLWGLQTLYFFQILIPSHHHQNIARFDNIIGRRHQNHIVPLLILDHDDLDSLVSSQIELSQGFLDE